MSEGRRVEVDGRLMEGVDVAQRRDGEACFGRAASVQANAEGRAVEALPDTSTPVQPHVHDLDVEESDTSTSTQPRAQDLVVENTDTSTPVQAHVQDFAAENPNTSTPVQAHVQDFAAEATDTSTPAQVHVQDFAVEKPNTSANAQTHAQDSAVEKPNTSTTVQAHVQDFAAEATDTSAPATPHAQDFVTASLLNTPHPQASSPASLHNTPTTAKSQKAHELGRKAEDFAANYLLSQGWTILARNVKNSHGELDIIALDPNSGPDELVVVEVRARSDTKVQGPLESIGSRKLRALIRSSQEYMESFGWAGFWRIDVIGINAEKKEAPDNWELEHISDITS